MNDAGKLKHRIHILVFLRGETRAQDTLVAHVVTHRARCWQVIHRLQQRFDRRYSAWYVDEPYWRAHGIAGRHGA